MKFPGRLRPQPRPGASRAPGRPSATGVSSAPERFAARARRVRLQPWRIAAVALIVAVVLAGLWWVLAMSPWLRVATVVIAGAAPDREQLIASIITGEVGKALVDVDTDGLTSRIAQERYFSDVQVTRSWPDELLVRVEERVPAVASVLSASSFELIDREGVAYEQVAALPGGVLKAVLARPGDAGSRVTAATVALHLPADLRTRASAVTVDAGARATLMIGKVHVLWGDASDSAIKAAVLRPLLERGGVARIDLTVPLNPVTSQETPASGSSGG